MVLYACASGILGWTGMTTLAQSSLRARDLADSISLPLRALVALVCAIGALGAWFLLDDLACCLAFSLACACMGALLVCDLCEHVLPTELVMGLLVFALVFRITASGIGNAFAIALLAGLIASCLLLLNHLRVRRGTGEIIGSGDVRMIVPLALFSGFDGIRPAHLLALCSWGHSRSCSSPAARRAATRTSHSRPDLPHGFSWERCCRCYSLELFMPYQFFSIVCN